MSAADSLVPLIKGSIKLQIAQLKAEAWQNLSAAGCCVGEERYDDAERYADSAKYALARLRRLEKGQ